MTALAVEDHQSAMERQKTAQSSEDKLRNMNTEYTVQMVQFCMFGLMQFHLHELGFFSNGNLVNPSLEGCCHVYK